jgi:hypothetical protein
MAFAIAMIDPASIPDHCATPTKRAGVHLNHPRYRRQAVLAVEGANAVSSGIGRTSSHQNGICHARRKGKSESHSGSNSEAASSLPNIEPSRAIRISFLKTG